MPASDSPGILESLLLSAKKLPGQTVGGLVDMSNMVLGGYANIAQAIQGKEITRQIGEGLVPKPVGGSEQINEFFGLPGKSSGLAEDSFSAMMGAVNPAVAAKTAALGVSKALIVAATTAGRTSAEISSARTALKAGKDAGQVFAETGMYRGPIDGQMRTVIDDSASSINQSVLYPKIPGGNVTELRVPTSLDDLLVHPELHALYPEMKDVAVVPNPALKVGNAATISTPAGIRIEMGPQRSDKDFQRVLLHETQHVVQLSEGFMGGGSPAQFLPAGFNESFSKIQSIAQDLRASIKAKTGISDQTLTQYAMGQKEIPPAIASLDDWSTYMRTRKTQEFAMNSADAAYLKYKNVAGEAEARSVESAFSLGPSSDGGQFFPLDLYDVRPQDLIANPLESKLKAAPK